MSKDVEIKEMDFYFDKIPATQVTPEMFGMKLNTKKAKELWSAYKKENRLTTMTDYENRLVYCDVLIPTTILKGEHGNERNKLNPILDFVMIAREKGLLTNRMSE